MISESVVHDADCKSLRSSREIRKINSLSFGQTLRVGKVLKLPVRNTSDIAKFEKKRMEYHQVLSESFKEHYVLYEIEPYRVKKGDSLWLLSNEFGFPLWLLYRVNHSLGHSTLHAG